MLIDARFVQPQTEFECDLCIVGAGPAGIAIADRLRETQLSIVLLESGGFEPELSSQNLLRGEITGRPYYALDTCRFRLFGGGSNRWGGWCRPLDPIDFERRDWIPDSGWPIGADALEKYDVGAAELFELADPRFDFDAWQERLPSPLSLNGTHFENAVFQYSPPTNFGERYRARLLNAPTIRTLVHANVVEIAVDADTNRVGRLHVAALTGQRFSIRPRGVVLAAGGIENARLLLASRNDRPSGLGNEFDCVGRYFMEHLHVPAGHLAVAPTANRNFYRQRAYAGAELRGVITPTAAAQYRRRLRATSIAIEPASFAIGHPFLSLPPALTFGPSRVYRSLRGGYFGAAVKALKRNAERAGTLPMRLHTYEQARAARHRAPAGARSGRLFSLYFRAEQAPDRESRVRLSEHRDALGVPRVRLEWRPASADFESIAGWLRVFDDDIRKHGLGRVIAPQAGWEDSVVGGLHHMGTTRMSAGPHNGVVDEHCRVHSIENLYVAGSSVFATGGYTNPTFTLVSLALRLADTLGRRLRQYLLA